jgi:hypothetical protein
VVTSFGATYTSLVPAHAASPVIGAVLPTKCGLLRTPTDGHRIVAIHRKKTTRSDSSQHAGTRHSGASLSGNSRPECRARFGHRASNPKRFWSSCQRLFDVLRWLTDRLQSRLPVRIPSAPPASLQFSGFSSSLRENAHLAEIRHPRSTGEPVSSGPNASFGDFSLFALWAVDLACRWIWRLALNKRRVRLLIGACSDRLRKSEGPLLRRPVHWNIKTAGL